MSVEREQPPITFGRAAVVWEGADPLCLPEREPHRRPVVSVPQAEVAAPQGRVSESHPRDFRGVRPVVKRDGRSRKKPKRWEVPTPEGREVTESEAAFSIWRQKPYMPTSNEHHGRPSVQGPGDDCLAPVRSLEHELVVEPRSHVYIREINISDTAPHIVVRSVIDSNNERLRLERAVEGENLDVRLNFPSAGRWDENRPQGRPCVSYGVESPTRVGRRRADCVRLISHAKLGLL